MHTPDKRIISSPVSKMPAPGFAASWLQMSWLFFYLALFPFHAAADRSVIIQSTTSLQNSGLYEAVLPPFTSLTGIQVKVVAVGTGQALKNAERCDGDLLIVHSRADELAFVAAGFGLARHDIMYNDFVIIGPASDPAGITGARDSLSALNAIAGARQLFISRGDDSGTNKAELRLWQAAGHNPARFDKHWYRESGQGMGSTLHLAVQLDGYTLSDRGTWLAFAAKGGHEILYSGDTRLFNQYGIIIVSPAHCPSVNYDGARQLSDWLRGPQGQKLISSYRRDGKRLFHANAR